MTSSNWDEFNTPDNDPAPDEELIAEIERNMRKNTGHATGTENPGEPQYPLLVVRRREKTPDIPRVPGRGIMYFRDCPTPYHHLAMLDAVTAQTESLGEIARHFQHSGKLNQFNGALGCLSEFTDDLEDALNTLSNSDQSEEETFEYIIEGLTEDSRNPAASREPDFTMFLDELEKILEQQSKEQEEKYKDWLDDFWRDEYSRWNHPPAETKQRITLDLLRRNSECQKDFQHLFNELNQMLHHQAEETGERLPKTAKDKMDFLGASHVARCISIRQTWTHCEDRRQLLEFSQNKENQAMAEAYRDVMFDLACSSDHHRSEIDGAGIRETGEITLMDEAIEAHEETTKLRARLRAEYNRNLKFTATGWNNRTSKNQIARMSNIEVEPHSHTFVFPETANGHSRNGLTPYLVFEWRGHKYAKPVNSPYPAGYPQIRVRIQSSEILAALRHNGSRRAGTTSEQAQEMMSLAEDELHCVTRDGMESLIEEASNSGVRANTLEELIRIAANRNEGSEQHLFKLAGKHLPPVDRKVAHKVLIFAKDQGIGNEQLMMMAQAMRTTTKEHGIRATGLEEEQLVILKNFMCTAGFNPEEVEDYLTELKDCLGELV